MKKMDKFDKALCIEGGITKLDNDLFSIENIVNNTESQSEKNSSIEDSNKKDASVLMTDYSVENNSDSEKNS